MAVEVPRQLMAVGCTLMPGVVDDGTCSRMGAMLCKTKASVLHQVCSMQADVVCLIRGFDKHAVVGLQNALVSMSDRQHITNDVTAHLCGSCMTGTKHGTAQEQAAVQVYLASMR